MSKFVKRAGTCICSTLIIVSFIVIGLFYTSTDVNAATRCVGQKTCLMSGQNAID